MDKKPLFNKDYIELISQTPDFNEYEFWSHLQDRIIIFNSEVDDLLVERVIMQILKFNRQDEGKEIAERQPITIYLNSPGGNVDIGLVLCEVIKKSKTPIHVIALGLAASMGSLLLMSGHVRKAYEYSNILIHDGSTVVHGSTNKVKDHMRFQEEKDKQIKEFIISNTKITEDKFDEMSDREWWLTAKMALEYGIIDEIIE